MKLNRRTVAVVATGVVCVLGSFLIGACQGQMAPMGMADYAPAQASLNSEMGAGHVARRRMATVATGAAPTAGVAEGAAAPQTDPARTDRLVVYSAEMHLVVDRIYENLNRIKTLAKKLGGHLQSMDGKSITVKVPAGRFNEAVEAVEQMGQVVHKQIAGVDVTDKMRDLRIRLDNAQRMRDRLLKLLDRIEKVEEALKVEKELERLTETIELLKGKIQYVEQSVAFSTLTVRLNSPVPQVQARLEQNLPFRWVLSLGRDLSPGPQGELRRGGLFSSGVGFTLPAGYIRYYEAKTLTRAMSAEGIIVRVTRHENFAGGDLAFWAPMIRKVLASQESINVKEMQEVELGTGLDARVLVGSKPIHGKTYGYMLGIAVEGRHVHIFEAWGPAKAFDTDREKLEKSFKSLYVGGFFPKLW